MAPLSLSSLVEEIRHPSAHRCCFAQKCRKQLNGTSVGIILESAMANSEAPLLSTPATHMLEEQANTFSMKRTSRLSDNEIFVRYELQRTLSEIKKAKYTKVALQFPDDLLPDAPRVFERLKKVSNPVSPISGPEQKSPVSSNDVFADVGTLNAPSEETPTVNYYILADTSYGACCVDEIAAEHVDADVVIHYGRACLSPTSRIPVIHVFTVRPLEQSDLLKDFQGFYTDVHQKIILMADVTYQSHLRNIHEALEIHGYRNLFMTDVVHDPTSPLPNRTIPDEVIADPSKLQEWHLFHISDPPESLPLTLASRVANIRVFPISRVGQDGSSEPFLASTSRALNRRYALLTSVATVSIYGILVNTVSVKNYLHIVDHLKAQILAAGKKSYTFVVGKVNAAKVANFSEIGAWVVIGCWESSLIDSKEFWKPVLTPFELELALQGDGERVWTGEWSGDFQEILDRPRLAVEEAGGDDANGITPDTKYTQDQEDGSESDSTPPDFDLRTGRYVSHTRPMQTSTRTSKDTVPDSDSLIKRTKGELAVIGGEVSPGAEHLRSIRTWKGLGSDFKIAYEEAGNLMEQGKRGIARGYAHGQDGVRT